jgi:RNA polymerase sigma-70 factor (ECF subfamily)
MGLGRDEQQHLPDPGEATSSATHWSVVLAAGDCDSAVRSAAIERLCQTYWRAVYAFARQHLPNHEDAQDLTQSFFAAFLEKQSFARADRSRGRFRTFLLQSVRNFILNEWRKAAAVKRGGGTALLSLDCEITADAWAAEAVEPLTPEHAYEKSWALASIEQSLVQLENEYHRAGKASLFKRLRLLLWEDKGDATYAEAAEALGMSEAAFKMAVSRLRARARELLRLEVANTVADAAEVEDELRHLLRIAQG